MRKNGLILLGIVVIAFLMRFIYLGTNPPSLTWDETAWGYNAYALGIDAKDEFGKFLPITYLESFGDFKPPVYAYLDVLPIKIFGLNEFGTRFPSAFFGTLSVLLTYFLVKEIFGKKREGLALMSAFMLAISPWHIMLSRAAFEANVASFFIILGVLLFLISIRRNMYLLSLSAVSFVISMNTFNSARVVAPIFVVFLFSVFYKKMITNLKPVIFAAIVGFVLFLPLLTFLRTPQAQLRYDEVNIFSDISVIDRTNQEIKNDNNAFWSKIIHNRRLTYGVEYIRHYFDNLNPGFLFITGDGNPKFSIQDVGELYIWEIPFLAMGLIMLFRKKEGKWWIVPVWLLVGIIPAAFARETPHALRTESVLPTFQILTALGVVEFVSLLPVVWRRIKVKKISIWILAVVIFLNFSYFTYNYFIHYAREFSGEWQYGYKEAVNYVDQVKDKYSTIYVTESLGRPYIYFLFYSKYSPQEFRREAVIQREVLGFVHVNKYSNFVFTNTLNKTIDSKALYIGVPDEVPKNAHIVKQFLLLNGKPSLIAYTQ